MKTLACEKKKKEKTSYTIFYTSHSRSSFFSTSLSTQGFLITGALDLAFGCFSRKFYILRYAVFIWSQTACISEQMTFLFICP